MSFQYCEVLAEIKLFAFDEEDEEKGIGKRNPIVSNYCPNHWFGNYQTIEDKLYKMFLMGRIELLEEEILQPNQISTVGVTFCSQPSDIEMIQVGFEWQMFEASRLIGKGKVLEILSKSEIKEHNNTNYERYIIFSKFENRQYVINKLDKLPKLDQKYLDFLIHYRGKEITADIVLFDYEQALNENRYLAKNYPFLMDKVWQIGTSGQGDSWFMRFGDNHILFYDHDKGEFESLDDFLDMEVTFLDFVQISFILKKLEDNLDDRNETLKRQLLAKIDEINKNFMVRFPYIYD